MKNIIILKPDEVFGGYIAVSKVAEVRGNDRAEVLMHIIRLTYERN